MASTSASMSTATSGAVVAEACVLNLTPPSKIGTGICFLDHMCDQLTSHGQLGVTLRCGVGSGAWFAPGLNHMYQGFDGLVACWSRSIWIALSARSFDR